MFGFNSGPSVLFHWAIYPFLFTLLIIVALQQALKSRSINSPTLFFLSLFLFTPKFRASYNSYYVVLLYHWHSGLICLGLSFLLYIEFMQCLSQYPKKTSCMLVHLLIYNTTSTSQYSLIYCSSMQNKICPDQQLWKQKLTQTDMRLFSLLKNLT